MRTEGIRFLTQNTTSLHELQSLGDKCLMDGQLNTVYLHVTQRCNLSCSYCYLDAGPNGFLGLQTEELRHIIRKILQLQPKRIVFTGGEPLMRKDLTELAQDVRLQSQSTQVCLNTNGTLITRNTAPILAQYFDEIRISIDGFKKNNDALRGRGTFESAIGAIDEIRKVGINPSVALTLTQKNEIEKEFFVHYLCHEWGIRTIRINPIKPLGRAGSRQDLLFEPENKAKRTPSTSNPPTCDRKCSCVGSTLSVTPMGLAFPCHWLSKNEYCVGDLRGESSSEISQHLKVLENSLKD